MSANLALQLIGTDAVKETKALHHYDAKQKAVIPSKQQRQQVKSNLLIDLLPHAVELVTTCVNAHATAMQVQHENQRIEFERETMQRQASMTEQDLSNRHTIEMTKLNQLGEDYMQAVHANQKASQYIKESLEQLNMQSEKLIAAMTQPGLSNEDRAWYLEAIKVIHFEKTQLIENKREISSQNHTAFIQGCDTLRDGPRTFTDVS